MDIDNLSMLKRADLQKLAKEHGIKANLKNSQIIEALRGKLSYKDGNEATASDQVAIECKDEAPVLIQHNLSTTSDDSIDGIVSLDSVKPLWEELGDNGFEESSLNQIPQPTRHSRTRKRNTSESKENARTRSSSRNKKSTDTPESKMIAKQVTPKQDVTPKNTKSIDLSTKTFSIPAKSRTLTRVPLKDKTPTSLAVKRSASDKNNSAQSKRSRKTEAGWKNEMRKAAEAMSQDTSTDKAPQGTSLHSSGKKKVVLFAAAGVTTAKSTPMTDKFAKAHEKNFGKMESIDDYQRRKDERVAKLFGSNKKREIVSRLAKPRTKTPVIVKPVTRPRPDFSSPFHRGKVAESAKKADKPDIFKPTVMSISKINTKFGKSSKTSKLVTPKKVTVTFAKSPKLSRKSRLSPKTPVTSGKSQRASLTPSQAISTPQSTKRNAFNLQESLKKPLTWVPHKGPLKSFEDTSAKPSLKERAKNMKNPKVTTRDKRRENMKKSRDAKKLDQLMKRRGIS